MSIGDIRRPLGNKVRAAEPRGLLKHRSRMGARKGKRFTFWLTAVLLTYAVVEGMSFAYFSVFSSDISFQQLGERRLRVLEASTSASLSTPVRDQIGGEFPESILHPYLGYSKEPSRDTEKNFGFERVPERDFRKGDVVTVGITGGSVAENFFRHINGHCWRPEWSQALLSIPEFSGKTIQYVLLGMRGYKQPQQLLAVTYYLTMGGALDVLINIDGVNEIVLGERMHAQGLFPGYPYHWRPMTTGYNTTRELAAVGRAGMLRAARKRLARRAQPLDFSAAANTVWYFSDRRLRADLARTLGQLDEIGMQGQEMDEENQTGYQYFRVGPAAAMRDAKPHPWTADLWSKSSQHLLELSKSSGFRYFHFLQPVPGLPGLKPLTAEEERLLGVDPFFRQSMRAGYPVLLRSAVQEFGAKNEFFRDLTGIFRSVEIPIYVDGCCHLNGDGKRIMARSIAATILESYGRPRPSAKVWPSIMSSPDCARQFAGTRYARM